MKYPLYLDYNSTTPLDPEVIDAMLPVMREHFGNASSSSHAYGWYAEELVSLARAQVASIIDASPEEIVFTSGGTESNNIAILGAVRRAARKQTELSIITSPTEHSAVLEPAESLKNLSVSVRKTEVDSFGRPTPESFADLVDESTSLVSLMLANNETGALTDISSLQSTAKKHSNALFHTDAAQAVGKIPVSVKNLGVDLLSFSSHKLYGPKGVGALYIRSGKPKVRLEKILLGGSQEGELRPGTLNVPGIVGLGKACEVAAGELETESARLRELSSSLLSKLRREHPDLYVNTPEDERQPGTLNLGFPGISSEEIIKRVSGKLAISAASACTTGSTEPSRVLKAMHLSKDRARSSFRIAVGRFTPEKEIDGIAQALLAAARL